MILRDSLKGGTREKVWEKVLQAVLQQTTEGPLNSSLSQTCEWWRVSELAPVVVPSCPAFLPPILKFFWKITEGFGSSVPLGGGWRGVTCSLHPSWSAAFTAFVSRAEVRQRHMGGWGSCPAPERCLCVRKHRESFQWALLSFRAFVSWEFIVAGGVQSLAVQSFYLRKILGELDSKIRTVWPFLRRGAACTDFWYENSWSFQERKSLLCLILLVDSVLVCV